MTTYNINPEAILENENVSSVVKAAMRRAMKQAFLLPGHWVRDLSDFEVDQLVELAEQAKDEDARNEPGPAGEELVLLTLILSTAEGCAPESDAEVMSYTGTLIAVIICESLARKGLVKIFHDKISFVAPDEVIVQKI